MIEIISDAKNVIARKEHYCNYCGGLIKIGEKYRTSTLKYDTIYTWKSHLKCSELHSLLNMEGDEGVTYEDFHEYIEEEFRYLNSDKLDNFDFIIPPFFDQLEFVYKAKKYQRNGQHDAKSQEERLRQIEEENYCDY